ncbi:NPH3 domain [Dillenia turbinata]|uniref:NPH3 domain n=1 Tax=Dillenia turbinata TaxID=194707 RepID=A0AAN8YYN0_9MAGN
MEIQSAYGIDNNGLVLTKFLLYYLKTAIQKKEKKKTTHIENFKSKYEGIVDTTILRIVSYFGLSKECRIGLEKLIGEMLDQATLYDLLVSGHDGRGVYDVNLVIRLIRVFVNDDGVCVLKIKKVGKVIDKYLREIFPDQNIMISVSYYC